MQYLSIIWRKHRDRNKISNLSRDTNAAKRWHGVGVGEGKADFIHVKLMDESQGQENIKQGWLQVRQFC